MSDDHSLAELESSGWAAIAAGRFAEAETAFRELTDRAHPDDALRLWHLFGVLASILNNLSRSSEATELYRRALREAQRAGSSRSEVGVSRYMLANRLLTLGEPADALAQVEPFLEGKGHVQALLRSVAAQASWKLGRHQEARQLAEAALDAAPSDERRTSLTGELEHILDSAG